MASRKPPTPNEPEDAEIGTDGDDSLQPDPAVTTNETPSAPGNSNRFFDWMRKLDIQRQPGWLGGVASGIGFRLGVDPIIVRGIIVVVAVLGGPALLLYAAAWLLLPDIDDRIHAEELVRGRFAPALIGIGIMALLSLLPLNQGFWFAGAAYWGDLSLGASFGRVLWAALLLAAVVALIIWVARRANGSGPAVVPATTDDKPDTVPMPVIPMEQLAEESSQLGSQLADAPPTPPPAPARDAPADELQAWKEQQSLWKQQHAEWKAQQSATERELRHQRALEAHERALTASAARTERRRLAKLAKPRINAATAWAALGLAIVAAGVAALMVGGNPDIGGHEATIALAVAAMTLGLAVIVAGTLRHRSGVLSFFALVAVLAMLVSASIPRDRVVFLWGTGWGVGGDARIAVPVGPLYLTVYEGSPGGTADIWQGTGYTELHVAKDTSVRLELSSSSGEITIFNQDGQGTGLGEGVDGLHRLGDEWRWSTVLGPDPEPDRTIRLQQGGGRLVIFDDNIVPAPAEESVEEGTQP